MKFWSPINTSTLAKWLFSKKWVRGLLDYYNVYGRKSAAEVNASFLRWQAGRGDRPFFAFLNYLDAHDPYMMLTGGIRPGTQIPGPTEWTPDTPRAMHELGIDIAAEVGRAEGKVGGGHDIGRELAGLGEQDL